MPSSLGSSSTGIRKEMKTINACAECYRRKQKCDRTWPCSNCVSRKVTWKCHYDHPRIHSTGTGTTEEVVGTYTVQAPVLPDEPPVIATAAEFPTADMGYSSVIGSNALVDFKQIFQKENGPHAFPTTHHHGFQRPRAFKSNLAEDQLPSRMAIDMLVEIFFDDVNWQYSILEKQYFDALAVCWYGTSVTTTLPHLSHEELERELCYFPALLFQVLGLAIQFLPPNSPIWKFLSQADLALCQDYSDIGAGLIMHTQSENVALTIVQAHFLRASWLKNVGKGVEAWRSIGNAIRSAQELELHRRKNSPGVTLSCMWYEEYKRRLWMNLCVWDTLTAMILGRPRAIHPDDCDVDEPVECNIPRDPSTYILDIEEVIAQRDRPNTVSNNLFLYRLSNLWHHMRALKNNTSDPKNSSIVQQLHVQVNHLMDGLPPTLRHELPDLSWDDQYPYLRQQREDIFTKANMMIMALHRPHIKYQAESRRAALQAATVILDSQHRTFMMASPHQYKTFGLSFYTIDAALLLSVVAAGYLREKDTEIIAKIDHVLQQAMQRLSAMHSFSPIARSGLVILRLCYSVLQKRLNCNISTLDLAKATAPEFGNYEQEIEVDVAKDRLYQHQPHPPDQQDPLSYASKSLPSQNSVSSPRTSNQTNSLPSDWTLAESADAGFMAGTTDQPSLHLSPSTTDFDETYWLNMINEIPDVTNTDPIGTTDGAALEHDTVWTQIHFFESDT